MRRLTLNIRASVTYKKPILFSLLRSFVCFRAVARGACAAW